MKIFVSCDRRMVEEIDRVIDIHVSFSKELVVTYFNFETKPFTKIFDRDKWDSLIFNKKRE